MATIDFDSFDARDASRSPISQHPAFPAIVALWFAALLGIGSLVLPVVLLERVVAMAGMAAATPDGPPLGFLERGLIALGAALVGAVAGLAIARRVARGHDERPSRVAKFSTGARRPISINEELGGEGLVNGRSFPVTRRRALAIAEDERPSDFLYMAPLPGHDEDDRETATDADPPAAVATETLELCDPLEDLAVAGALADFDEPESPYPDEDEPMTFKQEFQPFSPRAGGKAEEVLAGAGRSDQPEPLPFAAPSLARRALQAESETPFVEPQQPAPPEEPRFRGDWAEAEVTELGLVQLVQRLGASLERRRERVARVATAAPAAALVPPVGFDAAPEEEAVQAMAAYFGKPATSAAPEDVWQGDEAEAIVPPAPFADLQPAPAASRPSLLRPWQGENDEDELDALPSFSLPLRKPVVPTIAFDEPEQPQPVEDEDAGDGNDGSYSSLLAMRNPFAPKENGFVRIDEPEPETGAVEPAVVFPGRENPPSYADAGASLQRLFDPPGESTARPAAASSPPRPRPTTRSAPPWRRSSG